MEFYCKVEKNQAQLQRGKTQSRTISSSKTAVPTCDAQRHKPRSPEQTCFQILRTRLWFNNAAGVHLLPKEPAHFSSRAQLRMFLLSSLCLYKRLSLPTRNQVRQLNWEAPIHWFCQPPPALPWSKKQPGAGPAARHGTTQPGEKHHPLGINDVSRDPSALGNGTFKTMHVADFHCSAGLRVFRRRNFCLCVFSLRKTLT